MDGAGGEGCHSVGTLTLNLGFQNYESQSLESDLQTGGGSDLREVRLHLLPSPQMMEERPGEAAQGQTGSVF